MQKKEVKAILFDLDGTLVDSYTAWFHIVNDTLKSIGLKPMKEKEFSKRFGSPVEKDVKNLYQNRMTKQEIIKKYNFYFNKRKNHVKLFRHTSITLKKLKKSKVKLALITNSSRSIANGILKHHDLKKHFSAVVSMNDVKLSKPAPDMIFKACKMLKVKINEAILVGDSKNDMLACKRAGCVTVGYKTKGNYMIHHLSQIFSIIK